MKGAIVIMNNRYIVELENNHHYVLIDTVTGRVFYTPAQEDANTLASILNSYENGTSHIKNTKKDCRCCEHYSFNVIEEEDYCNLHHIVIQRMQIHQGCSDYTK